MQPVGQRRSRGFVHQPQNFKSCDFSGIFGGLALGIVEIGRHGDNRAVCRFTEKRFRPVLQFAKNECGNLRRRENFFSEPDANDVLTCRIDAEWKKLQLILNVRGPAPHQPLHGINRALGLLQQAPLRRFTNDDAAVRVDAYHRRAQRRSKRPGDTLRLPTLRICVRDQTVRRSQIDSDDSSHTSIKPPPALWRHW